MPLRPHLASILEHPRLSVPSAGPTSVIAIDGRAGSGKSTLAADLAAHLQAPIIGTDDLCFGWDDLTGIAPRLVRDVLQPLATHAHADYQIFDWIHGRPGQWQHLDAPKHLIIDGCASGSRLAAPYLSLLVWLDADDATRKTRAIARDGKTFAPHWDRWADQEQAHYAADDTRSRADIIIGVHSERNTDA